MKDEASRYKVSVPEGRRGKWAVERFVVPEHSIKGMRCALEGRPIPAGEYTALRDGGTFGTVMSDTPAEVRDIMPCVAAAKGRVLINGLGLGVLLNAVLAKASVSHVDVVEVEPDVAALVWPTYAGDLRAHLHIADAFEIKWPARAKWDVAWHDIWGGICSDNVQQMARLKKKYARRVRWQGCWCEREARRLVRIGCW
jgi:hypothetical protein